MNNRIIGGAGIAFAALCLAVPAPSASAAEGDPVVVMIEAPVQTCVPGQANDELTQPRIITGVDAVDAVIEPQWQEPDADGFSVRVGEVYPRPDAPNWVFDPASWMGDVYVDDGGNCGQEPELTVIAEPSMPGYVDDDTKLGDSVWIVPADTAEHTWVVNDQGELIAYPGEGYTYDEHEFVNFGTAPDAYNPPIPTPTPTDTTTPPDNGGGTGDGGNGDGGDNNGGGDDNGGSTPPTSTPVTNPTSTGGQSPTSGSDDKSGADTSKDGKKTTSTTNQVRRPGHNGAVTDSDSSLGVVGGSASVLALMAAAGYWIRRRRTSTM